MWQKDVSTSKPKTWTKANVAQWIQRRNIHEITLEDGSTAWESELRCVYNEKKEEIEELQDIIFSTVGDVLKDEEYREGYLAAQILMGNEQ